MKCESSPNHRPPDIVKGAGAVMLHVVALLESMWDWRGMTSGAGYEEAPRWFRINPDNFSGRRLYRIVGAGSKLLVTNSCRELVTSASKHGTPNPGWVKENLGYLETQGMDVLLLCGKVAQSTFRLSGYQTKAHVIEMDHPAARRWTNAALDALSARIQTLHTSKVTGPN
jgi:hypothetical protein